MGEGEDERGGKGGERGGTVDEEEDVAAPGEQQLRVVRGGGYGWEGGGKGGGGGKGPSRSRLLAGTAAVGAWAIGSVRTRSPLPVPTATTLRPAAGGIGETLRGWKWLRAATARAAWNGWPEGSCGRESESTSAYLGLIEWG